jgi:hypothetical protein
MTFDPIDIVSRLQSWLSDNRRRLRQIGLVLAISWFSAGLVWALWNLPAGLEFVVWPLTILLFAGIPLMTALNAVEFQLMSRVARTPVGWSEALETTIYASAANMLPIPGSIVARIAALKIRGTTIRTGSMVTALFAGIWGGTAFCYSGTWLAFMGHGILGIAFLVAGICLFGLCFLAAVRLGTPIPLLTQAFAIRFATTLVEITRQMLAIWSLGAAIGFGEASIFAVCGFVGNTMSVVPAGLGIREYIVAALSPLIALPPAVGFLSAVVNRMASMIGLAVLSAFFFIRQRKAA